MLRTVVVAVVTGTVGVDAATAPPWADRSAIPSGCLPEVKVPEYGRCLFDDQCATGFCCPYYRSCLGPNGLQQTGVKDMGDSLRMALVWGEGGARANIGGTDLRTSENGGTDVCSRTNAANQDIGRCTPYNDGIIALQDKGSFIKAFDLGNTQCECDARVVAEYKAGTWTGTFVNGKFQNSCPGSASPTPAPGATTTPAAAPTGAAVAVTIKGTLGLEVSDAAAFLNDAQAKAGVTAAIAGVCGVTTDFVTVTLAAARRLDAGARRLAAQVKADYAVVSADATTAASTVAKLAAETPTTLTTKVSAAVPATHSVVVKTSSTPQAVNNLQAATNLASRMSVGPPGALAAAFAVLGLAWGA